LAFTISTVAGVTTITGTDNPDVGSFNQVNVALQAFASDDVVTLTGAQSGADIKMGDGVDILTAPAFAASSVKLNKGADLFNGVSANAGVLAGGKGRDTINFTGSLTNFATVKLGKGADNLNIAGNANSGGVQVFGGAGNDTISAGVADNATSNAIYGGDGNDNITANGSWAVYGEDGDDNITGGAGAQNAIFGGAGDDTINGGGGNANDQLSGGAGANTFVFGTPQINSNGNVSDTILDWSQGTGNTIDYTNSLTKYANVSAGSTGGAGVTINANGAITGAATFAAADAAFSVLTTQGATTGGIANGTAVWSDGTNTFLFVQDSPVGQNAYDIVQVNNINATNFAISGGNITAFS